MTEKKRAPAKKRVTTVAKRSAYARALAIHNVQSESAAVGASPSAGVIGLSRKAPGPGKVRVFHSTPVVLFHGTPLEFLDQENTQATIEHMRKGLPASTFVVLSEQLQIPKERLYEALGVKRSTMEKRIKESEPLASGEADKAYWTTRAFKRAVEVLEDVSAAKSWMTRQIRSLGGVTPLSLLDTAAGYEIVMQTLGRIEHGIPS